MSYLAHFQLRLEPFSNAPDMRFFWPGAPYERGLARLRFAIEARRGLAVCTGPVGHGKTTLARRMYDELSSDEFVKGLLVVIHSDVTADWLLHKIAGLLGVAEPASDKLGLLGQIYGRLRQIDDAGKTAVILVDEVQMLASRELMEEFRGLLNIEIQGRKLINFIFFGLPETERALSLDLPLKNRVAVRVNLEPFDGEMTRRYVFHRCRIAGGAQNLFPPDVIERIHARSKGTPRLINTLCDNMLLEGFLSNSRVLTPEMVDKIAQELGLIEAPRPQMSIVDRILDEPAPEHAQGKFDSDWDVLTTASIDDILGFLSK
ncbi:MAG: AAA family ATPase [Deltaproteobacteria bacterium]|nr:AAA family ATPase [Deltaproteobacteria bacterium]